MGISYILIDESELSEKINLFVYRDFDSKHQLISIGSNSKCSVSRRKSPDSSKKSPKTLVFTFFSLRKLL